MGKRRNLVILAVVAALAALAAYPVLRGRNRDTRYASTTVERGDVVEVVGATGTLQAVTTVQVGSQVSGIIQNLYADFNSHVKKDQVVARLDPSLFQARVGQAKASLVSARANVDRARATVDDTKQKWERAQELSKQNLIPQSDLDTAKANYDGAVAQLKSNQAAVTQAEANLNQAQVDLDHTIISAPIDGVVINRSVDVGQTVAASFQAPTLFVIANDLANMQVNASIDEADIGRVRVGQDVVFRVDAYPDRTFAGRVQQIRLQPTTVSNVVSYNTIISADNSEGRLMPGMTATVSVVVRKAAGVLRIPATALRFRPEGFDAQRFMEANRPAPRPEGEASRWASNAEAAPAPGASPGASPSASPDAAAAKPAGQEQAQGQGTRGPWAGAGQRGGAGSAMGGGDRPRGMGNFGGGTGGGRMGGNFGGGMGGGARSSGIAFVLGDKGEPEPHFVRLGISDGQFVEVREGLAEGAPVVTGIDMGLSRGAPPRTGPSGSPSTNPFQPQPFQQRRRQ